MSKSLLNKIGLYTKQQLGQIVSSQLMSQARYFKDLNKNMQRQKITDITESLNKLLDKNMLPMEEQYFSITPFVDSRNGFHWIVIKVPRTNEYRNPGTIDVNNCLSFGNNLEGRLDFDIYMDSEDFYRNKNYNKPHHIKIVDFFIQPQNIGIGSYVLQKLDQIAFGLKVVFIIGDLAPRDYDNRNAQARFYTRNGYIVKLGDKTHCGCIKKNIV